jgi:hypothetical protein
MTEAFQFNSGGKSDPFILVRKAHGRVKGSSGDLIDFVEPVPKKYMGSTDKASLLYNGEEDYCSNTLDPVFKTVEISDLKRLEILRPRF